MMKNEFLILLLCIIAQFIVGQPVGTTMNVKGAQLHLRCANYSSASGESYYEAPTGWVILSYEIIDVTPKLGDCSLNVKTLQGPSIGYLKEHTKKKYDALLELIAKDGSESAKDFEAKIHAEYNELENRLNKFYNTHAKITIVGETKGRLLRSGGRIDVYANIIIIKMLETDEIDRRIKILSQEFVKISKS